MRSVSSSQVKAAHREVLVSLEEYKLLLENVCEILAQHPFLDACIQLVLRSICRRMSAYVGEILAQHPFFDACIQLVLRV